MDSAALTFLLGIGEALFKPAYGALVPSLVSPDALQGANAVTAVAEQTASVLGPATAGVIVATVGTRAAFVVDALTFAASIGTLVAIKEPQRDTRAPMLFLEAALEGLHPSPSEDGLPC